MPKSNLNSHVKYEINKEQEDESNQEDEYKGEERRTESVYNENHKNYNNANSYNNCNHSLHDINRLKSNNQTYATEHKKKLSLIPQQEHQVTEIKCAAFTCQTCGKAFKTKQQFEMHQYSHLKDCKRFKCEECGKRFKHKQQLQYHSYTHTDAKPFKCELCSKY